MQLSPLVLAGIPLRVTWVESFDVVLPMDYATYHVSTGCRRVQWPTSAPRLLRIRDREPAA